jgi:hypothetical protein
MRLGCKGLSETSSLFDLLVSDKEKKVFINIGYRFPSSQTLFIHHWLHPTKLECLSVVFFSGLSNVSELGHRDRIHNTYFSS